MNKHAVIMLVAGVVIGVVLAPKLTSLPVLNKLPQI